MNTDPFFTSSVGVLLFLFGVFQLILTIKIWIMTSDVHEIKKYLLKQAEETEPETNDRPFEIDDHVVRISDGKQMVISDIQNGKYICTTGSGFVREGEYDAGELRLFK